MVLIEKSTLFLIVLLIKKFVQNSVSILLKIFPSPCCQIGLISPMIAVKCTKLNKCWIVKDKFKFYITNDKFKTLNFFTIRMALITPHKNDK